MLIGSLLLLLLILQSLITSFVLSEIPPPPEIIITTNMKLPSSTSKSKKKNKRVSTTKDEINVSKMETQCMRKDANRPLVRVIEHGLPEAMQTHEMVVDAKSRSILATQMMEGRLLKLSYDKKGEIDSKVSSVIMDKGATTEDGNPFVGMHGLCQSTLFPGRVWITLQFVNRLCLVDIKTLKVEASIQCPRDLPNGETVGGPHSVLEANGRLYAGLKGGASCHGINILQEDAEEATSQAIYRVEIDPEVGDAIEGTGCLFETPPTPVMCAVDPDDNCWVATDSSGSITKIPKNAQSTADILKLPMPVEYAFLNQTGPGITIGPDGNPWFCILNGKGIIGKVHRDTNKVVIFELNRLDWNPNLRLVHMAFDKQDTLYAIASDLLDKSAINSLVRIKFDPKFEQVIAQHEMAFPSQASAVHRIVHLEDDVSEPSVLVSELAKSQILQIFKSTLPPMEAFPTKTYRSEVRKVFDPNQPCPMTGGPVCNCDFSSMFDGQEKEDTVDDKWFKDRVKSHMPEYYDRLFGDQKQD